MIGKQKLQERQEEMKKRIDAINAARQQALIDRPRCISCKHRYARDSSPFCSRCSAIGMQNRLRDTLPEVQVTSVPKYQIFGSQNGGSILLGEKVTLNEALEVYEKYRLEGSFGIKYPNGVWHKFNEELAKEEDILEPIEETTTNNQRTSAEFHRDILQDITDKKYYTRQQVAAELGISCTTISRWERKGKVPQPRRTVHNNQCLYTEENLQALKDYKEMEYVPPSDGSPQTGVASLPKAMKRTVKLDKRMERAISGRLGSLGKFF